jgi:hypothetical protein
MGVAGAVRHREPLANPMITLVRSSDQVVIGTNDDWQSDANAPQLQAAGFAPSNALEAALYVTLPPGAHTAIVEAVGGGTGVAVVAASRSHGDTPRWRVRHRVDESFGSVALDGQLGDDLSANGSIVDQRGSSPGPSQARGHLWPSRHRLCRIFPMTSRPAAGSLRASA